MKVMFKNLMIAATLLAGFASCSNDDDSTINGGIETGKATTFTLSIAQPKTYATDPNATADESTLNSVDVFIFNDAGTLEKRERLTGSEFTQSPTNEYTANRTIASTTGAKKIYVGVNLSDELARNVASQGLSAIYKVSTAADLMNPTNGFAMFSKVASDATFVESTDPTAATANKVSATVSRLLAKVSVIQSPTLSYNVLGGTISDLEFSLSNITQLYYMLPNVSGLSPVNSLSPSTLYNQDSYQALNASTTAITASNVSYALENASSQNLEGYTTYASIRAKFIPTTVVKLTTAGNGASGLVSETVPATPVTFYTVSNAGVRYYFLNQTDATAYDTEINGANTTLATYTNGYCYYKAYLNPDNNFNIYRNNLYKVNITAVNGIGESDKDIIDNPDKEISKPTNITVSVDIEDWIENTQNTEIG